VGNFPLTKKNKGAARVFSVLDIIKDMNQTFHGDSASWYTIPENRDLIAQLLFLYEISGGTKTFRWIDEDYTMLRAQVQIHKFSAKEIERELAAIETMGNKMFPDARVSVIGTAVQFAELNGKIVTGELKSIGAALIIICILLVLVFTSLGTGIIGMIPNIAPMMVIGGFMGYGNFPLDMMTMTIIPMLLGIAVDDTIHFINHIKFEFERCGSYEDAIIRSFGAVGKTLSMTTIILTATFMMYTLSPVGMMSRIGLLSSMGLLAALVTDYMLTSVLIVLTKPFGKEDNWESVEYLTKKVESECITS
jgi:predicted RND superfamily exporter protein